MNFWLVPSNEKIFHLHDYISNFDTVDWVQSRYKYEVGDFVFMYCSLPEAKIKYLFIIEKTNIPYVELSDDSAFWGKKHKKLSEVNTAKKTWIRMKLLKKVDSSLLNIENLKEHGLVKPPQGSLKLKDDLLAYLIDVFDSTYDDNDKEELLTEGTKVSIITNKYERSSIARLRCIQLKGCKCAICGFNFEEKYGEVGKNFIHIHHIVPISSIGESYKINYETDLIPVCPNCHAMLHRKIDGRTLSVNELKRLVNR